MSIVNLDSRTGGVGTVDERLRRRSRMRSAFARPELGSLGGAVLVFLFFAITARGTGMFAADGVISWATVSAQLAILAVGAALLMIAGEFDLSIGSMIGFAGMMIVIPTVHYGVPLGLSLVIAFAGALLVGYVNGIIVVRTRLPSFIVTLAFLFILRGLTIALSVLFTNRTIVGGLKTHSEGSVLGWLFGGKIGAPLFAALADHGLIGKLPNGAPVVAGIPMVIVWALVLVAIAGFVLNRTPVGNWIFAAGGDANAARSMGVPVARVKIGLFMLSAALATLYAACQVMEFGSAAADRGLLKEFEAIIAAVIGGCLLTGGYGSVMGAALGALIFGVVQIGILFTGINNDWFRVFLGLMLLIAVLFNTYVRRLVTGER
jgi:simple sugar transport system permease protein